MKNSYFCSPFIKKWLKVFKPIFVGFCGFSLLVNNAFAATFITVGDSLTAGLFQSSTYKYCPPTDRQFNADEAAICVGGGVRNLGGYQPYLVYKLNATTYNYGVSAATSDQIASLASSVLDRSMADYVVIMAGTNDVILARSTESIIFNISRIVNKAIESGIIPLVLTIPPLDYSGYHDLGGKVTELNFQLNETFSNYLVDSYSSLKVNWLANHSGDRIHLNDNGNELVAGAIAARLNDIKLIDIKIEKDSATILTMILNYLLEAD
ncbi:MAG: SGNH/GDSL hydrolase family protein [Acidiferrobacterales bacterium]|nr:SGNH/GDSL hydrolase family protein [Acidiferrobacterales bacterium]